MSTGIELQDLRSKPFLDVEESIRTQRSKRGYVYLLVEFIIGCEILYSYDRVASIYPLLAPIILGAASAGFAQSLIQLSRQSISTNRLLKFIVWGCINGCFTALWLDMLVSRFDNVIYEVITDQTVGAPFFQLLYTILSGIWDNESLTGINARATFSKSLRYSYCYWPFISISMFLLVPPQLMFFYNCVATFVWNLVLSKIN